MSSVENFVNRSYPRFASTTTTTTAQSVDSVEKTQAYKATVSTGATRWRGYGVGPPLPRMIGICWIRGDEPDFRPRCVDWPELGLPGKAWKRCPTVSPTRDTRLCNAITGQPIARAEWTAASY